MTEVFEKNKRRSKKLVMIAILVLSLTSVPMVIFPARAFTCPTSYASNTVEGCVVNDDTGNPVSGLYVFIIDCGGYQFTDHATSDGNGHFSFHTTLGNGTPCINPSSSYVVSVNGVTPPTWADGCHVPAPCNVVGVAAYDSTWSQWAGDVQTDSNGYGSLLISLTPARTVIVPAASLYSNTQFATLNYAMQNSYSISHTIGISASGASVSYTKSLGMTYTQEFKEPPNQAQFIGEPWYAIGYYCAGSNAESFYGWTCSQGLKNAGVTAQVPNTFWGTYPAYEYTNPGSVSGYCDTVQQPGTHSISYTQTAGTSASLGLSSGITLFGVAVNLSYSASVTSGTTDTIGLTISNPTTIGRTFRVYFAGGSCSNPTSELHVWEYPSLPPDFGLSANPSSFNIAQASTTWARSSTVTVQAINGFADPVTLSASSNDPNLQLSMSPSTVYPSGGSATSTLTVNDPYAADAGSYSITVLGQDGALSHSISIPVTIPDFSFTFSGDILCIPVGTTPAAPTIWVNSQNGFSGTVTFQTPTVSPVASGGPTATLNPTSVTSTPTQRGSTSLTVTSASTAGTYRFTVIATFGSLSHSMVVIDNVASTCSGGGGGGGSVGAGTLITLANGSQVPAQNLQVGMQLLSYDMTTHQYVTTTITRYFGVVTDNQMEIYAGNSKPLIVDQNPAQKLYVQLPDGTVTLMSVTELQVGYNLFDALSLQWIPITALHYQNGGNHVMYDIYTSAPGNYIANGILDPLKT